MIKKRPKSR